MFRSFKKSGPSLEIIYQFPKGSTDLKKIVLDADQLALINETYCSGAPEYYVQDTPTEISGIYGAVRLLLDCQMKGRQVEGVEILRPANNSKKFAKTVSYVCPVCKEERIIQLTKAHMKQIREHFDSMPWGQPATINYLDNHGDGPKKHIIDVTFRRDGEIRLVSRIDILLL